MSDGLEPQRKVMMEWLDFPDNEDDVRPLRAFAASEIRRLEADRAKLLRATQAATNALVPPALGDRVSVGRNADGRFFAAGDDARSLEAASSLNAVAELLDAAP